METFNDFDECVICLQDITNHCGNSANQTKETDFIPDQEDALIKLLQMQANSDLDSNVNSTQCQITKTESANNPNLGANKFKKYYCQSCTERNKVISDLFLEIDRLFRKLHEFQSSVRLDLNESCKLSQLKYHKVLLSKSESLRPCSSSLSAEKISSASIDQEHLHRKHDLRQKLVQLLLLPSTPKEKLSSETTEMELPLSPSFLSNAHENSPEDEPPAGSTSFGNETNFDESRYENPAVSLIEETQNSSKFNIKSNGYSQPITSDDFSLARKLYGIKECSINVNKLTNSDSRSSSLLKRIKSVLDSDFDAVPPTAQAPAPPVSPYTSELNSPCDSDNAADIGSIASFSPSDDAVSSDSGPEDDGDAEYSIKPRKKYVKSKQQCLKNSRKESPQTVAKTVVPKNQNNEPKQNKKKPKKLPYKSLTIHCTREGCPRKQGFSTKEDLEYHIKQAHEGITHPFECTFPDCTKSFPQKKYLRRHYESIHLGKFPHCCHFCGKGFTNTPNLKQHFITHTKVAAHKCTEPNCSRIFLTAHGLKYHQRSAHTGERPYRCDRCGKGFFTLFKLRDHIKAIHEKGDKPFVCDICGKDFFIKKYLYMHVRNSHNKKKIGSPPVEPTATIIIQETRDTEGIKLVPMPDTNNSERAGDIIIDISTNQGSALG